MCRKVRIGDLNSVALSYVSRFQIFWLLTIIILIGCSRKESDQSRLVISVPLSLNHIEGADPQSQAVSGELRYMVINIRNQQGLLVVNQNWEKHDNYGYIPSSPVFNLDRGIYTVQFLGVYGLEDSHHMEFAYGDFEKDFQLIDETASISAYLVGSTDLEGSVGGRYLRPSDGSAPTGTLQGEIQPPQAASSLNRLPPPMAVISSNIFNGWFTVFALSGSTKFTYRLLETGEPIFTDLNLESPELNVSNVALRLRVKSPAAYRWYSGATYTRPVEARRYILGHFGSAAGSTCYDSAPTPIEGLYNDSAHANPLNWNPDTCGTAPYENVCKESGLATSCSAQGTPFVDFLKFYPANIDRNEGAVFGMQGPFQILSSGNFLEGAYSSGSLNIGWNYLPGVGVESGILGGVDVFVNRAAPSDSNLDGGGPNGFDCNRLPSLGYSPEGVGVTGTSFAIQNVDQSSLYSLRVVLCPFRYLGAEKKYYSSILKSDSCSFGGCGGGGSATATKVAIHGLQAITTGQCGRIELSLLDSQGHSASLDQDVTVNLWADGTTPSFYFNSGCTGTAISSLTMLAHSSWTSLYFMTGNAPGNSVTLTPSVSNPALTSVAQTLAVVSSGNVAQIMLNPSQQTANVGTCLAVQVRATETNGNLVSSHNGSVAITTYGASAYAGSGCSGALGTLNFASGVATFYIKGLTAGWVSIEASATINSLFLTGHYGLSLTAQ